MIIRRNKKHVESSIPMSVSKNSNSPIHDRIIQFISENPDSTTKDIYNALPDIDQAKVRRAIRRMIEGHKMVQRFRVS